jgi:hypothetical protein
MENFAWADIFDFRKSFHNKHRRVTHLSHR